MAEQNTYDVGDKPRLWANFKVGGVNTSPTGLTYKCKKPDGSAITLVFGVDAALVKATADPDGNVVTDGWFYVDQSIDQSGEWNYRVIGTGAAEAAQQGSFNVRKVNV